LMCGIKDAKVLNILWWQSSALILSIRNKRNFSQEPML